MSHERMAQLALIDYLLDMDQKLSERRVALTMSPEQLARLDAYCATGRRQTGQPFARAEVIRLAIDQLIATVPPTAEFFGVVEP
jgi:hypothetical protein